MGLPRKRAKTEGALEMYPVADEVHLISENIYIQGFPNAFLIRIPKIGKLLCLRYCAPLGMSLKANSPLAWPPCSEGHPAAFTYVVRVKFTCIRKVRERSLDLDAEKGGSLTARGSLGN